ncbi:MAG: hypothetical protein ACHQ03_00765 [Candidatus Bathyarchaeia archaeon]
MKKILVAVMLLLTTLPFLAHPVAAMAMRAPAPPTGKAVILSSINRIFPLGYYENYMALRLKQAGYTTTFLTDGNVTIDFLVNQLNNYDIVIWRTMTYTWNHVVYFYVGESVNGATEQKYAADVSQGWINGNAGIFGITSNFISEHFTTGTLNNVKLMILLSSHSSDFGPTMVSAGATSVIYCNGVINMGFGLMDDLTSQLVDYLASGMNVYNAVFDSVNYLNNQAGQQDQLRSNIDDAYTPPFWFSGSSSLTIASAY